MSQRAKFRLSILLLTLFMGAAGGTVYGYAVHDGGLHNMIRGGLTGIAIALPISVFEIGFATSPSGTRFRRCNLATISLIRVAAYIAAILGPLLAGRWIDEGIPVWVDIFAPDIKLAFLYSITGGVTINFLLQVNRMLGQGVLLAFITGRHHHPQEEERIFLFLDITGSTRLAERIGNLRFHEFLNRFFFETTEAILETKGQVYRYVGDEVIVTWPRRRGIEHANCLRCAALMTERIHKRAAEFEREYGCAPHFRIAIHAGPVVVGEMGDVKQEIVFLGDVVNTTARMLEAARDLGQDILASGYLIERLTLPDGMSARPVGPVRLRGKDREIQLHAIDVAHADAEKQDPSRKENPRLTQVNTEHAKAV